MSLSTNVIGYADTDYWKYIIDWRTTDFYTQNPINNPGKTMNYSEYRKLREDGKLVGPGKAELLHNLQFPIHEEIDGI